MTQNYIWKLFILIILYINRVIERFKQLKKHTDTFTLVYKIEKNQIYDTRWTYKTLCRFKIHINGW